jgi:hypothetical protein
MGFTFTVFSARVEGDTVDLVAEKDGRPIRRRVTASKLLGADGQPDPDKIAEWMLYQDGDQQPKRAEFRRSYTVTTEASGESERVVSVEAAPLLTDAALTRLRGRALGRATAEQARQRAERAENSIPALKTEVAALAEAVADLRDIVYGLLDERSV